jgi:outer membrane protein
VGRTDARSVTIGRWIVIGVIGVILSAPARAEAADALKLGYIDALKVFDQSKNGKKAKGLLEEFVKSRQKIIDLEEAEIKELEDGLVKQESVLSPDAKKAKQEDLQKKFLAYQKKATDLNREIQDKKTDVLNEFHRQLQAVVKRVAEREGYTLVFDKGSGTPSEVSSLLYAKETLDVTEKVLAELDKDGNTK